MGIGRRRLWPQGLCYGQKAPTGLATVHWWCWPCDWGPMMSQHVAQVAGGGAEHCTLRGAYHLGTPPTPPKEPAPPRPPPPPPTLSKRDLSHKSGGGRVLPPPIWELGHRARGSLVTKILPSSTACLPLGAGSVPISAFSHYAPCAVGLAVPCGSSAEGWGGGGGGWSLLARLFPSEVALLTGPILGPRRPGVTRIPNSEGVEVVH